MNFSTLIRMGEQAGLKDYRLLTQKEFLVENGLLGRLQNHEGRDPFSPEARRNRAIRQPLLSDGMSELFKVLIQKKVSRSNLRFTFSRPCRDADGPKRTF
ncbi:hypothetical protein LJK88_19690 [Paenibacillus sp. P26]|nr:hypothetical protein LJK88_19690 [Paenibacillus sp. P26]